MSQSVQNKVKEMAEPIVGMKGLELVDVEYIKEGDDWVLRVYIDKEAGVSLNDCQEVSRALGNKLDIEDPIKDSYLLEVSSPGLDRPLKKEEDFIRFTGSLIDVSTYAPVIDDKKKFTARLLGIEDSDLEVEFEGEKYFISRAKIAQVKLAVEF